MKRTKLSTILMIIVVCVIIVGYLQLNKAYAVATCYNTCVYRDPCCSYYEGNCVPCYRMWCDTRACAVYQCPAHPDLTVHDCYTYCQCVDWQVPPVP